MVRLHLVPPDVWVVIGQQKIPHRYQVITTPKSPFVHWSKPVQRSDAGFKVVEERGFIDSDTKDKFIDPPCNRLRPS